jgi:hypothetical protein
MSRLPGDSLGIRSDGANFGAKWLLTPSNRRNIASFSSLTWLWKRWRLMLELAETAGVRLPERVQPPERRKAPMRLSEARFSSRIWFWKRLRLMAELAVTDNTRSHLGCPSVGAP